MEDSELRKLKASKSPDCLVEELDGETILFLPRTGKTVHLNETSRVIWELCDGKRTVEEISRALVAAYPESAAQVRTEVEDMLRKFRAEEIIDWV